MKFYSLSTLTVVLVFTGLAVSVSAREIDSESTDLNNILVTASSIEQPAAQVGSSVSVLTSSEIEALGYNNVADILRTLPGVGVSNNGGPGKASALRIRGEEGFRTKILIDGVDVSDPTGPQVSPQVHHIVSSQIERIEVLRGPQGVAYGADAGGVINIITRKPITGIEGGLNLEYGRYNEQNISGNIRGAIDNFDYSISAARLDTDGFNSRKSDLTGDDDGYENETFNLNTGLLLTDRFEMRINVRNTNADTEFDSCLGSNNCLDEFDQTNYKLSGLYDNGVLSHDVSVSRTDVDRESFANGITSFATNGTIDRIEYTGKARVSGASTLVYGAEYREEMVSPFTGPDLEQDQRGLYIEWHGSVSDAFHYILGVRHDDNEDFGNHTSYRATGNYRAHRSAFGETTLKASAGTGFRAPSLSETAYNNGPLAFAPAAGLALDEERSKGLDVGVEFRSYNNNFIEVIVFHQEIENEIFFDLSGFSGYLQETGASKSRGVEISGAFHITPVLKFSGNYTYNDTQTPDGQQRIRRPRNIVNLALDYQFANDRAHAIIHYRLSNDAEDEIFGAGRVELDDYSLVGFNLSYEISDFIQVYGRIENALDEEYEEVTGFNTAGASAFIGSRIRF